MQPQVLKFLPTVLLALASVPCAAQGATMTVPGLGQVLTGTDMKQTMACKGGAVSISGSSNKVVLTGSCTQITVSGRDNQVTAATVGKIVMGGSDNKLSWQKALKGSRPATSVTGSGNKISKR